MKQRHRGDEHLYSVNDVYGTEVTTGEEQGYESYMHNSQSNNVQFTIILLQEHGVFTVKISYAALVQQEFNIISPLDQ